MSCEDSFQKNVLETACDGLKSILWNIWQNHFKSIVVAVTGVVIYKIIKGHREKQRRAKWNSVGRDVVILHSIGRSTVSSNMSSFVVKLETYLRMAKINYQLDTSVPIGPMGKLPWITLNGEDMGDSQVIQEFLGKKFNKNFTDHLSLEEKGIARAFLIMADEHLCWGLKWWRVLKDPEIKFLSLMNCHGPMWKLFSYLSKKQVRNALFYQGLGRHSDSEVIHIIRQDLEAMSKYLGEKSFFMGDEPCELDCALFGILCQFVWGAPGSPFESMVRNEYRNLFEFTMRMRNKFYPDWDQLRLK